MELIEGTNAVFSIGLLLKTKNKRNQFADEVTTALYNIHSHKCESQNLLAPYFSIFVLRK